MPANVTIITPSLPERRALLLEAMGSVERQIRRPAAHVIGVDWLRVGPAHMRNQLASGIRTKWLAFLDDDDILFPLHIQVLTDTARCTEAAVISSLYAVEGKIELPPHECYPEFDQHNSLPVTVMIQTEAFRAVGGFPTDSAHEDWALWRKIKEAGYTFKCVHETTWRYRFLGGNRSRITM